MPLRLLYHRMGLHRYSKKPSGFAARHCPAATILLFIAISFSCGRVPSIPENAFRMNIGTEPPSLDWALATDSASIIVLENIMEGLTQFDNNMTPTPALAESWTISEDGKTYTFRIREGVRWSDGAPLTAQHFVDGWRRLLDPSTAAEYAYFLYDVENAESFNQGRIRDFSQVGVKAEDSRTIVVRLRKPLVYFPALTTFTATYPARLDVINRWGDNWTEPQHIVTLGPYRLKSWRHEYKISLEANPNYYAGPPPLKSVIMYMVEETNTALDLYESRALDYVSIPTYAIPFFKSRSDYRQLPFLSGYYYAFNTTRPPFDNPLARRAFSMAIDRSVLPKILNDSVVPASSWIPPGLLGHSPGIGMKFDPRQARQLLKEAGYNSPSSIPPITLAYNTNDTHKLVAENIKEQWKTNLGVDVHLDNMEWKVFLQLIKTNPPQIFRLGWNADYPDPDNFMAVFLSNSGNNHSRWANARYDRLVGLAAAEPNPEKRREYYYSAQRLLTEEDCVIAPLFFASLNRLVSPRVDKLDLNIMDILFLKRLMIKGGRL